MKKTSITYAALCLSSALGVAGELSPAAPQTSITPPSAPLYREGELQLDAFGVYGIGKGPDHAGPFRDHAWGGGIGLNYFFTQCVGLGIDADLKHGKENGAFGENHKTVKQYSASLLLRFPIENSSFAPYAFGGAGLTSIGENIGSAHAGIGLEYRFPESQVGLFTDTRWTYYGERFGKGDLNNFQIRSGIRFPF
jgi:hypothetical protein